MQHTIETPKQYQCRHIFTDGRRCASPCLRQQEFCYYHHTTRKPIANPQQRRSRRSTFHLPLPEDRSAIQASIGEVLQRIAANDLDPRRAGLLLYGLQIASLNLPKPQPAKTTASQAESQTISQTVEEITIDPELGILAPRTEISAIAPRKSVVAQLLERMMQDEQQQEEEATPQPATIPTLQATADDRSSPIVDVQGMRPYVAGVDTKKHRRFLARNAIIEVGIANGISLPSCGVQQQVWWEGMARRIALPAMVRSAIETA